MSAGSEQSGQVGHDTIVPSGCFMRVVVDCCNHKKSRCGLVIKVTIGILIIVGICRFCAIQFSFGLSMACRCVPVVAKVQLRKVFSSFCNEPNANAKHFNSLHLEQALQMLLVEIPDWHHSDGYLQRYVRSSLDAPWVKVGEPVEVTLGKKGVAWVDSEDYSNVRQQLDPFKDSNMDDRSPVGIFRLGPAFGHQLAEREIQLYDYIEINERYACVYAHESKYVNQIVHKTQVVPPEMNRAMSLNDQSGLYQLGVMIHPPRKVKDSELLSCLFLHVWDGRRIGTKGSTEMDLEDLEEIVYWLDREKNPVLVQLVSRDIPLIPNLPDPSSSPTPDELTEDNGGMRLSWSVR